MAKIIENIAATKLGVSYGVGRGRGSFTPGTMYEETNTTFGNARYAWMIYSDSAVTAGKDKPCVWLPSTTNQGLFTADYSDAKDIETKMNLVFPTVTVVNKEAQWVKCFGYHTIKQSTTVTTVAQFDAFDLVGDKLLDTSTTPARAAGIFLENPNSTPGNTVKVQLNGRKFM